MPKTKKVSRDERDNTSKRIDRPKKRPNPQKQSIEKVDTISASSKKNQSEY